MNHDLMLEDAAFETVQMPFNTFCTRTKCQTLIKAGTPAKKYDGATYAHVACPTSPLKNAAIHKRNDTGLRIG